MKSTLFSAASYIASFLIILNPYIISLEIMNISSFLVMCILLVLLGSSIVRGRSIYINHWLLIYLMFLFLWPHFISLIKLTPWDQNLLKSQVSILCMLVFGALMYSFMRSEDLRLFFISVIQIYITVIVINSVVVIFEFWFPAIRSFIESLLRSDASVDYAAGLRFRGLGSAGGASLSFAHGLAIPLGYVCYRIGKLNSISFLLVTVSIILSLLFIGRTGLLISVSGIFLCFVIKFSRYGHIGQARVIYGRILLSIGLIVAALNANHLIEMLPQHYQRYSIGVFTGGIDSLMAEGTVSYIITFYTLPNSALDVLFGAGNFSGGFEKAYLAPGDPGIMKVLTAYGFLGILIYLSILYWCWAQRKSLSGSVLLLMATLFLIGELKEPFLFKGYASRLFWFLFGASLASRNMLGAKTFLRDEPPTKQRS